MSAEVGLVVSALGVPVGIVADDAHTPRLQHQWSRSLTTVGPQVVVASDGDDYALAGRVTLAALEATAGRRLNLHAGAVADERGRTLSVVGPSGAGKTTAVGLLATRLGYLSDETTSVDDDLVVHPHPKPLSVVDGAPGAKRSVSPDDLALGRPPARCRLHRLVVLERGDDDSGLVPLPPGRAIALVVAQTSSLVLLPRPLERLAEVLDACGGVWALRYVEVTDRLDDLVGLLDEDPLPPEPRTHHPGGEPDEPPAGHWGRTPWLDAVEYVDELVVMNGDRVHVLAGLGLLLWLALGVDLTEAELVAHVEAEWGPHEQSADLVADALATLGAEGLVRRGG